MVRRSFLVLGLAAILAAAAIVPLPLLAIEPGAAVPIEPLIEIDAPADPINGRLLLTAVRLAEPNAVGAVMAWLDDDVDVLLRPAVIPAGVDEHEFTRMQQQLLQESAEVAAAVGFRLAGEPVHVVGMGARVAAVVPDGPADGKLREGDVILAIDGRPVRLASDVQRATARAHAGDDVTVVVARGSEQRDFRIEVAEVSPLGRPGLGVVVQTIDLDVRLPIGVRVDAGAIGGPSAGLMFALTIYDLVDGVDVARGRTIAGTGTIDLSGDVGVVGGVRQKVIAAREAGAEIFLVPEEEIDEARDASNEELIVIAVDTIDDALAALMPPSSGTAPSG